MKWLQLAAEHRWDFITQLWVIFLPIGEFWEDGKQFHSRITAPRMLCQRRNSLFFCFFLIRIMTSDGYSSASLCNAVLSEWPGKKWTVPGLLCFHDLFFHKQEAGHSTIYSCLRHSRSLWLSGKGRISWTAASQTQKPGSVGRLTMGWRNWQLLTFDYFKQRAFPSISHSPHEQFTVVKSLTGLLYQLG